MWIAKVAFWDKRIFPRGFISFKLVEKFDPLLLSMIHLEESISNQHVSKIDLTCSIKQLWFSMQDLWWRGQPFPWGQLWFTSVKHHSTFHVCSNHYAIISPDHFQKGPPCCSCQHNNFAAGSRYLLQYTSHSSMENQPFKCVPRNAFLTTSWCNASYGQKCLAARLCIITSHCFSTHIKNITLQFMQGNSLRQLTLKLPQTISIVLKWNLQSSFADKVSSLKDNQKEWPSSDFHGKCNPREESLFLNSSYIEVQL